MRIHNLEAREKTPERQTSNNTPTPMGADSAEGLAMVGKPAEELKLIKQMKQKLQTTTIPLLPFELDAHGTNTHYFEDYYDYIKPLGCGAFGFVVSALDKESGEEVALKVILNSLISL